MNVEFGRPWIPVSAETHVSPKQIIPPSKEALRVNLYIALLLIDGLAVTFGFALGGLFRFGDPFSEPAVDMMSVMIPVYIGIAINSRAFTIDVLRRPRLGIHRAMLSFVAAVGAILFVGFFLKASGGLSRLAFGIGAGSSALLLVMGRTAFAMVAPRLIGANPLSEVVIVDGIEIDRDPGTFHLDAAAANLEPDIADPMMLDRLGRYLRNVDRVVIACPPERRFEWAMVLKGANVGGEVLAPELNALGAIGTGHHAGDMTMRVSCGPLELRQRVAKRLLDLFLAGTALLILSPLMLAVALMIKLESPGPVLFVQKRLGRANTLFSMLKFRSMRAELCDANGDRSTGRDDDRITRVGAFIRRTSIDELPQLFHVLAGTMSIVGPRPHALGSTAGAKLFWEVDDRYWHRHASKPGLTGLAQIRGYRGATHELEDLTNRLQADLEYLAGWTIWRDISILMSTFRVLIHRNAF